MKIDRLLSIIITLLGQDLVSASTLAKKFEVSVRTIQRDMESIELAGIPVMSVQGPNGGYGILDSFKMDRQLVSPEDMFHIVTALRSVSDTMDDPSMDQTLDKMRSLLPVRMEDFLSGRSEKLHMDFRMLGGDPRHREVFKNIRQAVDQERVLRIRYTNARLESVLREVEPLTLAFQWRSWYLFAWCRYRQDYRIFRLSRIRDPEVLDAVFTRKPMRFEDFVAGNRGAWEQGMEEMVLRFHPDMTIMVEEHYPEESREVDDQGFLIVHTAMPLDNWVYGYILSWGHFVEVLEPRRIREVILESARSIIGNYEKKSNSH